MLKSTDNTFTREQFVMLREARTLIKEQFETDFSLHSENIVRDVYGYAVRSDSNELFRLFTNLNTLANSGLENPLNEEQFILLREAKRLIEPEFDQELALVEPDVMDSLYDFSLRSESEALFDIYRYLRSREREAEQQDARVTGAYFVHLKRLVALARGEYGDEVPTSYKDLIDAMPNLAERSNDSNLVELIAEASQWQVVPAKGTELIFAELSAPVFEFLREAKHAILEEFSEVFSLHTEETMDTLYSYALKSEHEDLFELFCDLHAAQTMTRPDAEIPTDWVNREQFAVLRQSRAAIRSEFGETIELRSAQIQETLYQYSLRADAEDLFGLCRDFHDLCAAEDRTMALPTKEEFRLLREARALVSEEFSEPLSLQANVVEYDLYRYAVNSEADELFDLYTDLMALPDKLATTAFDDVPLLLSKEEFKKLREARRLIAAEFDEVLALESADVLDALYRFALDSEEEGLFDIHAELNAGAVEADKAEPVAQEVELEAEAPVEERAENTEPEVESAAESAPEAPSKLRRIFSFGSKSEVVPASARVAQSPQRDAPKTRLPEPEVVELAEEEASAGEDEVTSEQSPVTTVEISEQIEEREEEQEEQVEELDEIAAQEEQVEPALESQEELAIETPEAAAEVAAEDSDDVADQDAEENTEQDAEEDDEPKLDSIQRAIQKRKGKRDKPAAKKKSNRPSSRPRVSLPPAPAKAADATEAWYLITDDGDLRVRLLNELSISASGELLLIADESEPLSAVINLGENGPIITPRANGVRVNDEEVAHSQALEAKDKITVEDGVIRVEFTQIDQAATAG